MIPKLPSHTVSEVPPEEATESTEEGGATPAEFGGRKNNMDPTRYGDWELNGKCVDF